MEHLRRLAVVFAVPIRLKIVTELYQREMSPKQFYEEFGGGSVARVAQHFERLRKTGWLRNLRNEGPGGARRGAIETIYRATDLAFCDRDTWTVLPYSIRAAFSWNTFKEIAEQLRRAMEVLTFQSRPDSHLTGTRLLLDQAGYERVAEAVTQEFAWQYEEQEDARRRASHTGEELFRIGDLCLAWSILSLDQQGWENVIASLEKLLAFICKEEGLAKARMKKSGEDSIAMVAALGAFETPKPIKEL